MVPKDSFEMTALFFLPSNLSDFDMPQHFCGSSEVFKGC
jgi:hypothetical protein